MKKIIILLLLTVSAYSQDYEVYAGGVTSEDKEMHSNYMIGGNFIIKTNQNRLYLNNLLLGFEHSAFMSNNRNITYESKQEAIDNCNCESDLIKFDETTGYSSKKEVRAVSLNFGVEITRRWYILTGVTNYQHLLLINNEVVNEYRTMHIDAGIKYFIKSNKWYFTPMIKFNPETISFGVGVAR